MALIPDVFDFVQLLDNTDFPGRKRGDRDTPSAIDFPRPKADVLEKDDKMLIVLEVPGMDKKDINLCIHNNRLQVSGECKAGPEYEGGKIRHQERSHGAFKRNFTVPPGIKEEEIKANMENGILKVCFPKQPQQPESKQIQIQ